MAIYQSSVLKKFLATQDETQVKAAFEKFNSYFHEPTVQENIRQSKEEQFQEGFMREFFVNVLDYTINPNPDFNLATELKNIKDAKKTDGAILKDGKALAVIELKGTDTKDLEKVTEQAFNYKNNQPECIYVITSNFEKLRFYIHNAVEHLEFNLFALTFERFQLLWLLLQKDNLLSGIPQKVKEESLLEEEKVTKRLYKDYSAFKNDLWNDLCQNNPQIDELELYKKSQKLLDRFLFIFFAEDKGLLPPNSISEIVHHFRKLKEMDEYRPLFSIYKKYFGYMNLGRKQPGKAEIHAYNGGLFKEDDVLDKLTISDEVLEKHCLKLTEYDFATEVDTNILGHIFEHSLNDIENVRAKLAGEEVDKSKTKRKKDGVFYTPKYITKYIVDNTVGKLCEEKKRELEISDDVYREAKQRSRKRIANLEAYRAWLLGLKICDPACGSGAFLNQALEFLIQEHLYLDELTATYHGASLMLSDIENQILEQNLYGVDINEESVEIARLSLWLRTAQKGRKLTSLSSNIKVGNSLIDDPEVAGDLAFNWQEEFPEVFKKGGFDVVIGNPPYVRAELLGDYIDYFGKKYQAYDPASDLFAYFYELGTLMIKKENGVMGFISNTFDKTTAGKVLRNYLQKQTHLIDYVDFTEVQIFEGATTYPVIIILDRDKPEGEFSYTKVPKSEQGKVINVELLPRVSVEQTTLNSDSWSFLPSAIVKMLSRLQKLPSVKEVFGKSYRGLITGLNDAFIVQGEWSLGEHIKMIYEGKELKKWNPPEPLQKLILFPSGWTKEKYGNEISEDVALEKLKQELPTIMEHLLPFEEKGKNRYDKGEFWWELRNCAYYELFEKPKIIFPNLQNGNKFCLDTKGVFVNAPAVFLPANSKTLLCVLNSKIVWKFLKSICVVRSGGYIEVKPQYFEQIPVPEFKNENEFDKQADAILAATSSLQNITSSFIEHVQSRFSIDKPSKKLQNWPALDFKGFLAELKKAKVQLSLEEEAEWMAYFNKKKAEANTLQAEIDRIDREIDSMVYQLYGLTDAEIAIVENASRT